MYFGKPVHTYTLKEAIGDKNVLPLCIDYVKTVKMNNQLLLLDKEVKGIDYEEALLDDRRCKVVADDILEHYESKTSGKRYNAILACQSIALLIKYYKLLLQNKQNIKIATIYSYDPNEDCKEGDSPTIAKNALAKIIEEYNKRPENNSNFSLNTYKAYERDVISNFRNKNIDILLVVDKCLTGMDFVRCNTLYLDKSMKMHGLIQAISRTIRTNDEQKICGNIICYQTSRKTMDDALAHFNNDEDVYNDVTLKPLEDLVNELNAKFTECKGKKRLASSKSENDQLEFVNSFRELMHIYNQIINYVDFDIEKTEMDMKTYFELQGLYKDIYNQIKPVVHKESILDDIDFEIQLLGRTKVNFDYLVELLIRYRDEKGDKKRTRSKVNKVVMEINDKSKRELVMRFVNHFMDEDIDGLYKDPIVEYENFINNEKDKELQAIADQFSIDKESLKKISDDYSFYQDDIGLNRDVTTLLSSNNDIDITNRISIITQLPGMIKGFFDKFNDITIY